MIKFVKKISFCIAIWFFGAAWCTFAYAELTLNGMATYSHLGSDQFIAAIYCETPTSDSRQLLLSSEEKVMELRIVAEQIRARRFKRMWIESMAINAGSTELEKHAQDMADFNNFLRIKLRAGDILRIERLNEEGVQIFVDGHPLGSIANPRFFDLLLRTWIGPVPLSTRFKKQLLVAGAVSDDQQRLFRATTPNPQRVAAVGAALNAAVATSVAPLESSATAAAPAQEPVAATDQPPAPTKPEGASNEEAVAQAQAKDNAAQKAPEPAPADDNTGKPTEKDTAQAEKSAVKKPVETKPAVASSLKSEEDVFKDDIIEDDEGDQVTAEALLTKQLYISKLTRWTGGFVEYPRSAIKRNQQGTVRIAVAINRNGKVVKATIEEKTEFRSLNKAAIKAIKKASPYPAVPDSIKDEQFVFTVPVRFRIM